MDHLEYLLSYLEAIKHNLEEDDEMQEIFNKQPFSYFSISDISMFFLITDRDGKHNYEDFIWFKEIYQNYILENSKIKRYNLYELFCRFKCQNKIKKNEQINLLEDWLKCFGNINFDGYKNFLSNNLSTTMTNFIKFCNKSFFYSNGKVDKVKKFLEIINNLKDLCDNSTSNDLLKLIWSDFYKYVVEELMFFKTNNITGILEIKFYNEFIEDVAKILNISVEKLKNIQIKEKSIISQYLLSAFKKLKSIKL